jgi:ubiquinone/menaquinone biosynthesis C-methylase UbiE
MHEEHADGEKHSGFRFPADRRHVLKAEERRQWLPPEPILEAAGVRQGEKVLDVGAGTGFWTAPLSRMVGPEGRIVAVDVEPIMLDEIRSLVSAEHLDNVETVLSQDVQIPVPDGSATFAVLGFVLHEPDDPPALLAEVRRILQPDGRVLVIDWQKKPTEQGPPLGHRIARDDARAMIEAAGFRVQEIDGPTDEVYILLGEAGGRD